MMRWSLFFILVGLVGILGPVALSAAEAEPRDETLQAFIRARAAEDSFWDPERRFYVGEDGAALARRDIARERALAERARERGLHEEPEIAAELARQPLLVSREMADRHVRGQVTVTDEEVEAWYEANISDFTRPPVARFQFLFERVENSGDVEAARERLEERRQRVLDGEESFVALAALQEGLDPDEADEEAVTLRGRRGQYAPEIDELLFSLEPGGISETTRTRHGWHVVRLVDRTEGEVAPLEERRSQIEARLRQAKLASFRQQAEEQLAEAFPLEWHGLPDGDAPPGQDHVLATLEGEEYTAGEARQHLAAPPAEATEEQWRLAAEELAVTMRLHLWAAEEGWHEREQYSERVTQNENTILARALFDELVSEIEVTREEMREHFEENPGRFRHREEYEVRELFLSAPTEQEVPNRGDLHLARQKVREAMESIRQKLVEGTSMDDLPEELPEESSGLVVTDRGWAPQGPRGRLLDVAVRDLEPGEYSGVEESRRGFHIYLLEDKRPPRPMEFEEAEERIAVMLRATRTEDMRRELVAEIDGELGFSDEP